MRTGSCSRSPHKKHTHALTRESGDERLSSAPIFPVTLLLCTSNPLDIPALEDEEFEDFGSGPVSKAAPGAAPEVSVEALRFGGWCKVHGASSGSGGGGFDQWSVAD